MPVSLFGMLSLTMAQWRFTYVSHILQPQLPTAMRLAVATSPHGSVARLSGGGYSVPSASHPRVTPSARPGRVPVAEHRIFNFPDKYACDFVSHTPEGLRLRLSAGSPTSARRDLQALRPDCPPFGPCLSAPLACCFSRRLNSGSHVLAISFNPSSRPP